MLHVFIVYCMVLNPTMCRTMEVVPADGHRVTSQMECAMAGMMGSTAVFMYEGAQWQTNGVQCKEPEPDEVAEWLAARGKN